MIRTDDVVSAMTPLLFRKSYEEPDPNDHRRWLHEVPRTPEGKLDVPALQARWQSESEKRRSDQLKAHEASNKKLAADEKVWRQNQPTLKC